MLFAFNKLIIIFIRFKKKENHHFSLFYLFWLIKKGRIHPTQNAATKAIAKRKKQEKTFHF
jgi:hypothetical protein